MRRRLPRLGLAVVRGRSMLPTLRDGDRLVVRYGANPRIGQVVVARFPGGVIVVKRVTLVDADGFWVSRDNPDEGIDSWSVGAIARDDVLGVVLGRLWPRPALKV
jgi:nickel-type superoxide dismutase maturation protease